MTATIASPAISKVETATIASLAISKADTNVNREMDGDRPVSMDDTSPIEQVELTVPKTDDPTLPVWTLRMWILGLGCCILLSFINQFFSYRSEPLKISSLSATLAALPLGKFMASVLPRRDVSIPFTNGRFSFSLNPGPFNVKEHVLIAIFASAGNAFGYGGAFAIEMVNLMKVFYRTQISFMVALLLVITSQLIGYGWAGLMRKQLIDPAHMWWPSNMVQVTLFRTLHEKEATKKTTALSRSQFFYVVVMASFAYYVLPGYFMPFLTCISILCWIWPTSVTMHQIGSGYKGLGIGAFTLDWAAVSSFLGSPLVFPWATLVNMAVGAGLFLYVVMPVVYWKNLYHAKNFPIVSSGLFTPSGSPFNVTAAVEGKPQGQLHLSAFFALGHALLFTAPAATITHVLLFHGKEIWLRVTSTSKEKEGMQQMDVHTRLMSRYPDIPSSWFLSMLLLCIIGAAVISVHYRNQVQIPWWGVLFGCGIASITTLPIGVIAATTNLTPSLMVVMQYIGGFLFPGNPIANQGLKLYGHMSMQQAIFFLADFKLGHYMKIPPRSMFLVQVIGTGIAGTINLATGWWLLGSTAHICNADGLLPAGSQWTCPWDVVAFDTTVIWGVVGPKRSFGSEGPYKGLIYWCLVGGGVAPAVVWLWSKLWRGGGRGRSWVGAINMPVILGATGWMPAAGVINYTSWFIIGMVFNCVVYRRRKRWWQKYNYVLSAGLDAGTAIMGVILFLSLGLSGHQNSYLSWWGSQPSPNGCPLARCPSSPHLRVPGCPLPS